MNPHSETTNRLSLTKPSNTSSTNQSGRYLKSTLIPLCCVVTILCIYLPANRRFITPIIQPVPDPSIPRFHRLVDESTIERNGSSANASPDPSSSVSRTLVRTSPGPSDVDSLPSECTPVERIVYIKTHKTGSTTTASILERFGYLRNLSFAMSKGSHILSNEHLFKRTMPYQIPNRTRHDFDMLVNHVRYNRKEMDISVPNAKYITILRDPVAQLESAFGYFEMGKHLRIVSNNPFRTFMSEPEKYYKQKSYFWTRSRNGQMYDLGFDHALDENVAKIKEKIDQLSNELDLVMITEYFDESLILLKKLFCWDYLDILYISNGIRSQSHRFTLDQDIAERIRAWSAADVMLYEHFNRTFWKKIEEYGPSFQEDLNHFKEIEQNAMDTCIDVQKNNTGDRREDKLTLKNHSKFCEDLLRGDVPYTALIRKGMVNRAAQEAAGKIT